MAALVNWSVRCEGRCGVIPSLLAEHTTSMPAVLELIATLSIDAMRIDPMHVDSIGPSAVEKVFAKAERVASN